MTTLYTALNQLATTVGSAYTAASGSLTVASGYGTTIATEITAAGAAAISAGAPVRISVVKAAHAGDDPIAPANRTIYSVTGITGDVLTIGAALEGTTDRNYSIGDAVRINLTAGTIADLNARVTTGWDALSTLVNSPVSITGTTSLTSSAFGAWQVCSGTSSNYAVTLPNPSGNAGKLIGFRMATGLTKLVTLTQYGSETIDGAATRVMWAGETAVLLTDGTNWFKVAGKSIPFTSVINRSLTNFSIPGSYAQTNIPMDTLVSGPSVMFDSGGGQAVIVRPGTYSCGVTAFLTVSGIPSCYIGITRNSNANQAGVGYFENTVQAGVILNSVSTLYYFGAGDTVNIGIQINPAATADVTTYPSSIFLAEVPSW
jgi:hypothetical protein